MVIKNIVRSIHASTIYKPPAVNSAKWLIG